MSIFNDALQAEWSLWMLEEEALKRVSSLSVYKQIHFGGLGEYRRELMQIIEFLPERESK